ncbi:MAG: hypothetical protein QG673_1842 [Pseudomonadota bacterium]|nr:hypothetical protein [Pseudomonadota bacterium]
MKYTGKTLILRLKELRFKMRLAKTEGERQIYAEAITHCIGDIKHMRSKARRDILKLIVGVVIFLALLTALLHSIATLEHDDNDNQSIGHAISEQAVLSSN